MAPPAPVTEPVAVPPPPAAVAEPEEESDPNSPWVLRLGNYLTGKGRDPSKPAVPVVLRLGNYLHDKQPGPWSILANEKPHDPLVSCTRDPQSRLCRHLVRHLVHHRTIRHGRLFSPHRRRGPPPNPEGLRE